MKQNKEFYDKIFKHTIFVFCFVFFVFINVLRFYQLEPEIKLKENIASQKVSYQSFVLFQTQDRTPMIFLQNRYDDTYLNTIFKNIKIKSYPTISLLMCSEDNFSEIQKKLKNMFPNQNFSKLECNISLERFQELYNQNTLIVLVLKNQNLKHHTALKFAYQNQLKPFIKTMEIKHDI